MVVMPWDTNSSAPHAQRPGAANRLHPCHARRRLRAEDELGLQRYKRVVAPGVRVEAGGRDLLRRLKDRLPPCDGSAAWPMKPKCVSDSDDQQQGVGEDAWNSCAVASVPTQHANPKVKLLRTSICFEAARDRKKGDLPAPAKPSHSSDFNAPAVSNTYKPCSGTRHAGPASGAGPGCPGARSVEWVHFTLPAGTSVAARC